MELVTIAEIELNRPHSAEGRGIHSGSNPMTGQFPIADSSVEMMLAKVIDFAEKCGVSRNSLTLLQQVSSYNYSAAQGIVVFDLQTNGVLYSVPYAYCRAYPALKIGNRYFRLDEISDVGAARNK